MNAIILHPELASSPVPSIPAEALAKRNELVLQAQSIERVVGAASQNAAASVLGDIKQVLDTVEKHRVELKNPFLEAGRQIDSKAKEYTGPLIEQDRRLRKALSDYLAAEQRKADEIRRKQEAELEAIRLQRLEAEAAARVSTDEAEIAKAQEAMLEAETKAVDVIMATPMKSASEPPDNVKARPDWDVTVSNAAALYKAFPELVELKPRMTEIKKAVKRMATENPEVAPSLPGCVVTQTVSLSVMKEAA